MQDYIYSVIAFLAMVIHLIINFDMLPGRKVSSMHAVRDYRVFLSGVFAYYLTDAAWGVLAVRSLVTSRSRGISRWTSKGRRRCPHRSLWTAT